MDRTDRSLDYLRIPLDFSSNFQIAS
jgi:hypothetical protein